MSHPFRIDSHRQTELLREATSRRLPTVVTSRMSDGWTTLKSRFLGVNADRRELLIEYPSSPGAVTPEIVGGQSIGVSFRRGHKKCVFNTMVLERCQFPVAGTPGIPALKLCWPDEMCELQRRLYYRALVPEGMIVPVEVWRQSIGGTRPPDAQVYRGTMLDLSAGGISMALPRETLPQWHDDDPAGCSFPVDAGEPPATVSGRLKHWEELADDRIRVGLHFVGLDSSPEQRGALERVIRLAIRFQRAEISRHGKRRNL